MRSLWAAGMLLRRLLTERGIILLTFVLVAATSFVFAAAPRLFNRVSDDALRDAVRVAPASQRNLALSLDSRPRAGLRGRRLRSARLRRGARGAVPSLGRWPDLRPLSPRHHRPLPHSRSAEVRDPHLSALPGPPDRCDPARLRALAGRPRRAAGHRGLRIGRARCWPAGRAGRLRSCALDRRGR